MKQSEIIEFISKKISSYENCQTPNQLFHTSSEFHGMYNFCKQFSLIDEIDMIKLWNYHSTSFFENCDRLYFTESNDET